MTETTHDAQMERYTQPYRGPSTPRAQQERAERAFTELEKKLELLLSEVNALLDSTKAALETCRESLAGKSHDSGS